MHCPVGVLLSRIFCTIYDVGEQDGKAFIVEAVPITRAPRAMAI